MIQKSHYDCRYFTYQPRYYPAGKFRFRTERNHDSSSLKAETALLSEVQSVIGKFTQPLSASGLRPPVVRRDRKTSVEYKKVPLTKRSLLTKDILRTIAQRS